jgi:hypothetical protein
MRSDDGGIPVQIAGLTPMFLFPRLAKRDCHRCEAASRSLNLENALRMSIYSNTIIGSTSIVAVKETRLAYLCGLRAAVNWRIGRHRGLPRAAALTGANEIEAQQAIARRSSLSQIRTWDSPALTA